MLKCEKNDFVEIFLSRVGEKLYHALRIHPAMSPTLRVYKAMYFKNGELTYCFANKILQCEFYKVLETKTFDFFIQRSIDINFRFS